MISLMRAQFFLPEFHCDLNLIELVWGYAKYHEWNMLFMLCLIHNWFNLGYHNVCHGKFTIAKLLVPQCLDMCNTLTIFFWKRDQWGRGMTWLCQNQWGQRGPVLPQYRWPQLTIVPVLQNSEKLPLWQLLACTHPKFRKTMAYMDAYQYVSVPFTSDLPWILKFLSRKGLDCQQTMFAMKQYRSHHQVGSLCKIAQLRRK